MKWFARLLAVVGLCVAGWTGFGLAPLTAAANDFSLGVPGASMTIAAQLNSADAKLTTEYGKKIDLNNTNISSYKEYKGLYPTLAQKLIANAPYGSVDEILSLPGLSETQKARLKDYIDQGIFTVTEVDPVFIDGDDRINDGSYK
ncbi:MAG: photosystem II complex extrinsic protein PsbU [Cyanobacteria bacterium]|nr:photosystem II complex extrinsic protein PsbU [Cyanobacteriota bacterium]